MVRIGQSECPKGSLHLQPLPLDSRKEEASDSEGSSELHLDGLAVHEEGLLASVHFCEFPLAVDFYIFLLKEA